MSNIQDRKLVLKAVLMACWQRSSKAAVAFVSTRLTYRPTRWLMYEDAIDRLDGLVQGKEVDVYYDPARLSRSVVIQGASDDNAIRTALALVLLVVAVWQAAGIQH